MRCRVAFFVAQNCQGDLTTVIAIAYEDQKPMGRQQRPPARGRVRPSEDWPGWHPEVQRGLKFLLPFAAGSRSAEALGDMAV